MPVRSERELTALLELSRMLAGECCGAPFGEGLHRLVHTVRARHAAAFAARTDGLELAAEQGSSGDGEIPSSSTEVSWRLAVAHAAAEAARLRKPWSWPAPERGAADHSKRQVFSALGKCQALAVPVLHQRDVLGVIVLVTPAAEVLDEQTRRFVETVANLIALAVERERRAERDVEVRDQLSEAGRLASLGMLTATVAHELRNPLTALELHLEEEARIIEDLRATPDAVAFERMAHELIEISLDAGAALTRMRATVSQLSSASRREPAMQKVDVSAIVKESLALAAASLRQRGVSLVEHCDSGCRVWGTRDGLGQVVLNLVFNAADACESASGPNRTVTVRTTIEGNRVVLSVEDTGPGVPADTIQKIFQPFFTTKPRGRGTGLGLKICSDVVAAHHGHIEVVNRPEGGASFRVMLPRLASAETPTMGIPPIASTSRLRISGTKVRTVLVVDDDELFARSMRRSLRPHEVLTVGNASEAERVLGDPQYNPDLVLCDVGLPGAGGDLVHARIVATRPVIAQKFVFVTGGVCSKHEADYLRASGRPTLLKPINPAEIRAILAAPVGLPLGGLQTLRPGSTEDGTVPPSPPERSTRSAR